MYPRFKVFLYVTAFVFLGFGAIAFFKSRTPNEKAESMPATTVRVENTATPPGITALTPNAIPGNWREDIGVPVLCYHQIVTDQKYRQRPTPYAVTVKQFREQMDWMSKNGFYTISADDLLAYVQGNKQLDFSNGKRPFVLTFDDGNNDFIDHAKSILDSHKFKGVLFIYPTYIFARKPRSLTWTQIKASGEAGHEIESHTMWHPQLNTMTDAEQKAQFADSKKNLDSKGGASVQHLAYPFGIYNSRSIDLLRETGYSSAYTTFYGGNQVGEDPYLLRRYLVVKADNMKAFARKTLTRALPLRYLNAKPGMELKEPADLSFRIPGGLDASKLKVKIFSTAQSFDYDAKIGNLVVRAKPSSKKLSVLEIAYKEGATDFLANALLNHPRTAKQAEKPIVKKAKKRRKKRTRKSEA